MINRVEYDIILAIALRAISNNAGSFAFAPHLTVPSWRRRSWTHRAPKQAPLARCGLVAVHALLFRMNNYSAQMLQAADRAARIKNDRCAFLCTYLNSHAFSTEQLILSCRFERSIQLQRQHDIDEAAANEAIQRSQVEHMHRQQQVTLAARARPCLITYATCRTKSSRFTSCSAGETGPSRPTATTSPWPPRCASFGQHQPSNHYAKPVSF